MIHFLRFMYDGSPDWWTGNVYGNVFVVVILGPLGWLWSKTRFWPLRPIKHGIRSLHDHFERVHAHNEWQARHTARILDHLGVPRDEHPSFKDL